MVISLTANLCSDSSNLFSYRPHPFLTFSHSPTVFGITLVGVNLGPAASLGLWMSDCLITVTLISSYKRSVHAVARYQP